ncbi:hypothetical protein DPMN_143332 [Dreissena polymorpha]|uniref:Uncharacterized protein n=1 Tax=Dreissena polymorpha TaxID=45954 RepID=A0A9D4JLL5_DREPO|nr:hypothetical protein DPMN_143332 [Dreissena polymorpha]
MTLHPGDSCVNNWMLKAMAKDSGFLKHKRITNHSVRKFLVPIYSWVKSGASTSFLSLDHSLKVVKICCTQNYSRNGTTEAEAGAPGLAMGPCIVEIDCIVIREVQCRNEEVIVKGNFGWVWPMWAGRPRIFRIVIREVQYQLEVNWCRHEEIVVKGNFEWVWPMWAGRPRIGRIVIRKVQYQSRIKGNFGWVWPMWAGRPRIEVQYQLEVNRCRNEEVIVKGNFGWVWPMWAGRPRIDRIVIRDVQYQFEVNRCRNEEVNAPPQPP